MKKVITFETHKYAPELNKMFINNIEFVYHWNNGAKFIPIGQDYKELIQSYRREFKKPRNKFAYRVSYEYEQNGTFDFNTGKFVLHFRTLEETMEHLKQNNELRNTTQREKINMIAKRINTRIKKIWY